MNKGSFSFVAMLVINPIVILFYQNCSMSPISYAKNPTNAKPSQILTRQVASEPKLISTAIKKINCTEEPNKECPKAE